MWFPYALTFALTSAVGIIISKKILKETNEYLYLWLSGIFVLPVFFLIIISFYQIPKIDEVFLLVTFTSMAFDVVAAIFAYKAIKSAEVSLVAPMSAFNPVFTAVISLIFIGEKITLGGGIGILLVCLGAYVLQIDKLRRNLLDPIRSLLTNRAIQFSLLAYFLWGITPILQKTAILHTSPQTPAFAGFSGLFGMMFVLTFFAAKHFKNIGPSVKRNFIFYILIVVLTIVSNISAFTAFSLTNVGYAAAVFKLSMIFTVILGWVFFKEQNIKDRFLGSSIMLLGVYLLVR